MKFEEAMTFGRKERRRLEKMNKVKIPGSSIPYINPERGYKKARKARLDLINSKQHENYRSR